MLRKLKLQIVENNLSAKHDILNILNYASFSAQHRTTSDPNELRTFEKYHAALTLLSSGFTPLLNPGILFDKRKQPLKVDLAATDPRNGNIIVALCTSGPTDDTFWSILKVIARSDNGKAIVFSPEEIDKSILRKKIPGAVESGKVSFETVGWFEDKLEDSMLDTLRMLELLVNETRIRMLAPLFRKNTANKKEYRTKINPKLVYSNLDTLSQAGFLNEAEQGAYALSNFGKTMLAEFLTFLEKTRRILDESKQQQDELLDKGGAK